MKIIKQVGERVFRFQVAMVDNHEYRFKGFVYSKEIGKPLWLVEDTIKNGEDKGELVERKEVKKEDIVKATKVCISSLNKEIDKHVKKGYLPCKKGFKPVFRSALTYARRFNPDHEWTDEAYVIENTYTKQFY